MVFADEFTLKWSGRDRLLELITGSQCRAHNEAPDRDWRMGVSQPLG
jgi:hypothetical protein